MYKRLITDWGILSAPPCTPGTSWNSMELWSQLTVIYCCWVRSTWRRKSHSTIEWIWEACATEAANSISLHQAQLCLNIFFQMEASQRVCALNLLELMPPILCRGMRPFSLLEDGKTLWDGGGFISHCTVGRSCPPVCHWSQFTSSWRKTAGPCQIICGWTASEWWSRGMFWSL